MASLFTQHYVTERVAARCDGISCSALMQGRDLSDDESASRDNQLGSSKRCEAVQETKGEVEGADPITAVGTKIKMTRICGMGEFLILNLKRFVIEPGARAVKHRDTLVTISAVEQIDIFEDLTLAGAPKRQPYSFYAAIVHDGKSPNSGHYYNIVKRGVAYFIVDDDQVKPLPEKEALALACKGCVLLFRTASL